MAHANEEDVVIAFRQAVEEEMRQMQSERYKKPEDIFAGGASLEEAVRRVAAQHHELEREVALLRTILLRLVSDPLDDNDIDNDIAPTA